MMAWLHAWNKPNQSGSEAPQVWTKEPKQAWRQEKANLMMMSVTALQKKFQVPHSSLFMTVQNECVAPLLFKQVPCPPWRLTLQTNESCILRTFHGEVTPMCIPSGSIDICV
jgi:hypothetical protein